MWASTVTKPNEKKAVGVQPLDSHVTNMRDFFVAQRHEVPALEKRLADLAAKKSTLTARHEVRLKKDIELEIKELREEIETRVSMSREHEYELMIAPYMNSYNQRVEVDEPAGSAPRNITVPGCGRRRETIDMYVQQYDATASRQTTLINEYLMEIDHQPPKMTLNMRDECPLCKDVLMLISAKAIMTCSKCGYSVAYLDATMSSMSYSDDVEFSSFSYKRINHFNEWLQQVQAKETFEISQDILEAVMAELHRQRVTSVEDVTPKKVREVLKTLKLRKAYEHVAQITCKLTGRRPLRISSETEEMCRLMFIAVQPAFEKHCPKDRKNFLSYSYCLYKFFQLLGLDAFLETFTLLKGRDKLAKQDEIFKKICEELDWDFVPSV